MKKIAHMSIATVVILLLVITLVPLQKMLYDPTGHLMPVEEAVRLIENRYQGTVIHVKQEKRYYQIVMEKNNKHYEVKMNARNGDVLAIVSAKVSSDTSEVITKAQPTESGIDNKLWTNHYSKLVKREQHRPTGVISVPTAPPLTSEQLPDRLNESEVIQIVEKQVDGRVDSIDFDEEGKVPSYLAKIKTPEGKEAIFQVEPITGKILTVTWDDDDSLEEEEDDKKKESKEKSEDEDRKKAEKGKKEDDD